MKAHYSEPPEQQETNMGELKMTTTARERQERKAEKSKGVS